MEMPAWHLVWRHTHVVMCLPLSLSHKIESSSVLGDFHRGHWEQSPVSSPRHLEITQPQAGGKIA